MKTFQKRPFLLLLACLTAILTVNPARGANCLWLGTETSDWNTPANWSGSTVPVTSDSVQIINGKTLTINNGAFPNVFWRIGHNLSSSTDTSSGTLILSGTGAATALDDLTVGRQSGTGTIYVRDSASLKVNRHAMFGMTNTDVTTGPAVGYLYQSGGSVAVTSTLYLGGSKDANNGNTFGIGLYEMSAGTLTTAGIAIGYKQAAPNASQVAAGIDPDGTSVFTQTGGSVTVTGSNFLTVGGDFYGNNSNGKGQYNISGGTIHTQILAIGARNADGKMYISETNPNVPTVVTTSSNIILGRHNGTGYLEISSGKLVGGENILVGAVADGYTLGTGEILQTGGTVQANSLTGTLYIGGYNSGTATSVSKGTYTIRGGDLSVKSVQVASQVGSIGAFNIEGGTVAVSGAVTSLGTLNISGGTVNLSGAVNSNASGNNTVSISDGNVTVDGYFYLQNRTTTISGGNVKVGRIQKTEGGDAVLNIVGGDATIDVGRFAINYGHAQTTKFDFKATSTGMTTLNGLGLEPANNGDVVCGTYSAGIAGGFAVMNNSLQSLLYSPKVRTDSAGQSMEYMYLNNGTGVWDLTRTFTYNGATVTDHGTVTGSPTYLNAAITDLSINANLNASAKLGSIVVDGNGVEFAFADGKQPTAEGIEAGWFELSGEGRFSLQLDLSGVTVGGLQDIVDWMVADSADTLDVAPLGDNSVVISSLSLFDDQTHYLAFDFSGYGAGTVGVTRLSGQAVPEPSTWALLLLGLAAIAWQRKRRA